MWLAITTTWLDGLMARWALMNIWRLDIACARDRVPESSDHATGLVSRMTLKREDGVAAELC